MRPYLEDLLNRLSDTTPVKSSSESVSWAAHREAEQLTDRSMVDELIEAAKRLKPRQRQGCYFTIGKIGVNLADESCAKALLELLPIETNKYGLGTLLEAIGAIPKGATLDLSSISTLLEDKRWLVRHAAIQAFDNSLNLDSESFILEHLASTVDPYDQTYCHSVLSSIGTPRALPALEANTKSRKRDVKDSALWAIEAIRERNPI